MNDRRFNMIREIRKRPFRSRVVEGKYFFSEKAIPNGF